MSLLDRIFKEQLEMSNGRIRFTGAHWSFDPPESRVALVGGGEGKALKSKDADGLPMTLTKGQGVHCPNPEAGRGFPRYAREKRPVQWFVPGSHCRRCEHYRKGGTDGLRYPHCAWTREQRGGEKGAVREFGSLLKGAISDANKMMGK
ncbi:MAG: hypothetical protein GY769_08155 [bacterium]|nr:hypothetical protein [bacterium]